MGTQRWRLKELELAKNKWEPIPKSELKNFDKEILDLIQTAYSPIGGHPNYNSTSDVHSQGADYEVIDIDDDPNPDAVSVTKNKSSNKKFTATGHDNSKPAKSAVVNHKADLLKDKGYYIEVSGRIKDILLGKGVSPVTDEEAVRSLLKGKEIKWNGDGTYDRKIGNKTYTKIILGKPKLQEQKPYKMKKSELKKLIKEEIKSNLGEGGAYGPQSGILFEEVMENVHEQISDLEDGQFLTIKVKNLGDLEFDVMFNLMEDKPGYGISNFSDDNPIIKGINKGVDAIGKGLRKFDKKMQPLGRAANKAMRNE